MCVEKCATRFRCTAVFLLVLFGIVLLVPLLLVSDDKSTADGGIRNALHMSNT